MLKCFEAANAKGRLKKNAKVISFSKSKLERVKLQKFNGAIFLNHINTVYQTATGNVPPSWAYFVVW